MRQLLSPLTLYLRHSSHDSDRVLPAPGMRNELTHLLNNFSFQSGVLRSTPVSAWLEAVVIQEQLHGLFGHEVANSVTGWGELLEMRVVLQPSDFNPLPYVT